MTEPSLCTPVFAHKGTVRLQFHVSANTRPPPYQHVSGRSWEAIMAQSVCALISGHGHTICRNHEGWWVACCQRSRHSQ